MKIHHQHSALFWILLLFCHQLLACKSASPTPALSPSASVFGRDAVDTLLSENGYVKIKPGAFMMGSLPDEEEGEAGERFEQGERPQHRVTITKEFEMGKYEVTQKQWQAVMGANPSVFKGTELPVINVSWNDVQDFIKRLQPLDEKYIYRLPTEAEWEYACRAGSTGAFSGEEFKPENDAEKRREEKRREKKLRGKTFNERLDEKLKEKVEREKKFESPEYAKTLNEMGWYNGNAQNRPHAVGQLKPNAWGLYDIHGNVWEWVQDWYDPEYYKVSPAEDPQGPAQGQSKVQRGGNWQVPARACRAAIRGSLLPVERNHVSGFRLVRVKIGAKKL